MAKPRPWTVLPHGPLTRVDDNLWAVTSQMPNVQAFDRRMTIVKRQDGTLLFYNAVPVDEPTMAEIRALGEPRLLVVPHYLHMVDAPAFREKLGVKVYAPPASLDEARSRMPIEGPIEELPPDPTVRAESVTGLKTGEAVLLVASGPRVSLLVADLILNTRPVKGLSGFVFGLIGFTGDRPKLPWPVKMRVLKDKVRLRAELETLAKAPGLSRIVVSHGEIIEDDAPGVLRAIAASV